MNYGRDCVNFIPIQPMKTPLLYYLAMTDIEALTGLLQKAGLKIKETKRYPFFKLEEE